jgi:peptidoglycan/xylan/chitin deacetylase (PgdA/CDA1 family)
VSLAALFNIIFQDQLAMRRPYSFDEAVIQCLYQSGLYRLFEPRYAGRGSILTFHRVRPPVRSGSFAPNRGLEISPKYLEQLIRLLLSKGIDIVSIDEAVQRLAAPDASRRFACLTFDDGYGDNFEHAYPVCRKLGVPMMIYITSGFLDRIATPWWVVLEELVNEQAQIIFSWDGVRHVHRLETPVEKALSFESLGELFHGMVASDRECLIGELCRASGRDYRVRALDEFMTWGNAREMAESGLVTIGGHTVSHPQLAMLDVAVAAHEIGEGCKTIEQRLQRSVLHVAYPFGRPRDAGPREFELCRMLGLKTAVTTRHGNLMPEHRDQVFAWPRLPVSGTRQSCAAAEVTLSGTLAALVNGFRRTVVA